MALVGTAHPTHCLASKQWHTHITEGSNVCAHRERERSSRLEKPQQMTSLREEWARYWPWNGWRSA